MGARWGTVGYAAGSGALQGYLPTAGYAEHVLPLPQPSADLKPRLFRTSCAGCRMRWPSWPPSPASLAAGIMCRRLPLPLPPPRAAGTRSVAISAVHSRAFRDLPAGRTRAVYGAAKLNLAKHRDGVISCFCCILKATEGAGR